MTLEDLSRLQFALTAIFHIMFPAMTVGLSVFLTVVYGLYWKTRRPVYLQMFRFWRRIFGVGFALGVVAGAVLTFEFGLNWGVFSRVTGPIIGPIIAMEVVTAFFVEAGFIGILLYGDGRVKERTMFVSTLLVSIGTLLSTTWILIANSWMQTPAGFAIADDGTFVPTNWLEIIFNPSFPLRFLHMFLAVLISASTFIIGIAAWYLIRGRSLPFAKRSFSMAIGVLAVLLPIQISVGDDVALEVVVEHQMPKFAAIEGHWQTDSNGYNLFIVTDQADQENRADVEVPFLGALIGQDLTGQNFLPGLSDVEPDPDLQPPMWMTFWGFRLMFYGSMVLFGIAMAGVVLRLRGRLFTSHRFHKVCLWSAPVGILAIIGGWVTAETGRQPWVVYGRLRTEDAVSDLAPAHLVFSVIGFVVLYAVMLAAYIGYIVWAVRRGPEHDRPGAIIADDDDLDDLDAEAAAGSTGAAASASVGSGGTPVGGGSTPVTGEKTEPTEGREGS
ncbi:cytochrome ubiquinol oxidase subunit I [Brevibacterium casei]|uniref:Cytochrome d ubiquinol oxidase subunit I n=1 Tax=Brevibacterium casei CIP 102111 TaxID=1255625 RepID=A0A2H1JLX0_9MICO|nr:cytochrome ubiquinol oxidase subunit I [Brevibacterium casei]QPR39275.1 cytochrome ubiquinol oxidase subunit I [Brevibacterium casei]QPR43441.1 cytochrome ubiquinol oxidase subunit I [Brevibacterium casei]SMX88298.1 cytochrome d ubiquinol oxidase subunit I [Brevibacterium casei CIP 102111]